MGIMRISKSGKVSVDEIEEREQHGQGGDVSIAVIVHAVDEHTADQRRD